MSSHHICNHAVYKNGRVYATHKCNNDTEPYRTDELSLHDFITYVLNGEIRMTRKPTTKLEKAIDLAGHKFEMPEIDYEFEGSRVVKYLLYYKSGLTSEKTPDEWNEWRINYKSLVKNYIIKRLEK